MTNILRAFAAVIAILSAGILFALADLLGDRGLAADANQTAGYTATQEIVIGVMALGSLVLSVTMLVLLLPAVRSFAIRLG